MLRKTATLLAGFEDGKKRIKKPKIKWALKAGKIKEINLPLQPPWASTGLLPTLKPHHFVQDFRKGNQSFSALGPDPSPTEKLPFVENPISSQGLPRI